MKKILLIVSLTAFTTAAFAGHEVDLNTSQHTMKIQNAARPGGGGGSNLVDHGGPVLVSPKVVCIFWGFGATGNSYTAAMQNFRNTGTRNYINMLSQYRSAGTGATANMGGNTNDKYDASTPPLNVTDAIVQSEVKKFFGGAEDPSAVYEVFIPSGSYSSSGTSTSCGGPTLAYCAYHSNFNDGTINVKYSIEPYPGCSGCQASGFSIEQNAEHFMIHETRETISDANGNAWYDNSGNEADDKCAWSPAPFIDNTTGFGYQYEWSNSAAGCIQK